MPDARSLGHALISGCFGSSWAHNRPDSLKLCVNVHCVRDRQDAAEDGNPYVQLTTSTVLPPTASALTNEWEPRNPEPALQWLDAWTDLLPATLINHILNNLVYPKVESTVFLVIVDVQPSAASY